MFNRLRDGDATAGGGSPPRARHHRRQTSGQGCRASSLTTCLASWRRTGCMSAKGGKRTVRSTVTTLAGFLLVALRLASRALSQVRPSARPPDCQPSRLEHRLLVRSSALVGASQCRAPDVRQWGSTCPQQGRHRQRRRGRICPSDFFVQAHIEVCHDRALIDFARPDQRLKGLSIRRWERCQKISALLFRERSFLLGSRATRHEQADYDQNLAHLPHLHLRLWRPSKAKLDGRCERLQRVDSGCL